MCEQGVYVSHKVYIINVQWLFNLIAYAHTCRCYNYCE